MSVQQVSCPSCRAVTRVVATMTSVRCPSCGAIFNPNAPAPAPAPAQAPAQAQAAAKQPMDMDDPDISGNKQLIAVLVGVAAMTLVIVGITIAVLISNRGKKAKREAAAAAEEAAMPLPKPDFRVVDLPDTVRMKIYKDYRQAAGSSSEKKVMVQKDSPLGQRLSGTLGAIVDREVKLHALQNNISEEDVYQIIAEGTAKEWSLPVGERSEEAKELAEDGATLEK